MDELKPQIAQMLQSKVVNDYLEKLKSGAKIEVTEIQVQVKPMPEAAKDSKSEKK
jgi:peptidyl-prolyl cis-trans isomerase C